ncbi:MULTISPECIES: hypothetical protein [Xenorhabdus]|uniref:hypothetical protein n=1 Tax=Xenorhabdus TaxID=626 RepID=UPI00068EFE74|nr:MULTISPECIES: hypothetical protein [Xenorhabdus]
MSIPDTPVPDGLTSGTAINDPAIPNKCSSFIKGIFDSLPIVISYISISFTFGLSAIKSSLEAISDKKTATWAFGLTDKIFTRANQTPGKKIGKIGIVLDSIGVASICSLLIVAGNADMMREHNKLFLTLIGCLIICVCFYKTRSISISTLSRSDIFGLTFKVFMN